jgi:hypothetical protein
VEDPLLIPISQFDFLKQNKNKNKKELTKTDRQSKMLRARSCAVRMKPGDGGAHSALQEKENQCLQSLYKLILSDTQELLKRDRKQKKIRAFLT